MALIMWKSLLLYNRLKTASENEKHIVGTIDSDNFDI